MAKDDDRPLHCGEPMVPIVYGMPGSELIELSVDDWDEHMAEDEWI